MLADEGRPKEPRLAALKALQQLADPSLAPLEQAFLCGAGGPVCVVGVLKEELHYGVFGTQSRCGSENALARRRPR